MSDERRAVLISVPRKMKKELVRRATAMEVSVNDVVVQALAKTYGVKFEPIGRRTTAGTESVHIVLRMDAELKKAIQMDAIVNEENMQSTIVAALAKRLRIDVAIRKPNKRSPFGGGRGRSSRPLASAQAGRRRAGTPTRTSNTRPRSH